MWDFVEGEFLFDATESDGEYSATLHLAEMVGFIGLPHPETFSNSSVYREHFNPNGENAAFPRKIITEDSSRNVEVRRGYTKHDTRSS